MLNYTFSESQVIEFQKLLLLYEKSKAILIQAETEEGNAIVSCLNE